MFDIDTLNQMNIERKAEERDTQETKNRILSMVNPIKKQKEWNKYFPKYKYAVEGLTEEDLQNFNNAPW